MEGCMSEFKVGEGNLDIEMYYMAELKVINDYCEIIYDYLARRFSSRLTCGQVR